MSTTWVYLFRNLLRRRTRTAVGVLGIALTTGLLTAIQIGLDSISISYIDLVALQAGKADIVITRAGGDPFNPLSFEAGPLEERLAQNPLLRGLSPRWLGVVQVQSRGQEHYAVLLGLDPERERELDITGLVPEPTLQGQTCAISKTLAQKLNVQPGGRLFVRSPTTYAESSLQLETVLERQLLLPQQIRDYVVVNPAAARELLGERDRVHMLAGGLRNPRSYYDARDLHSSVLRLKTAGASIAADLGMDYTVRLPKAAAITAFQDFTSPLRAVFGVFALLSLTITGLLIYSLVSVSVEERVREYGILRTLGAKKFDIFRLVISESFLLCFLGVIPGVLAGAALAGALVKLVGLVLGRQGAAITVEVSAGALLLTVIGGAALSIGSALVPALQATRWRIVDAIEPMRRGQIPRGVPADRRVNRPLLLAGLALAGVSVVVFFVLPNAFLSGNPSLIGTVVLCLLVSILLGLTLISVGILPCVQKLLLAGFGWSFGPAAGLAERNLERHRRRHNTTALLFTLSVSLVLFIASLVALASRTALAVVEHTHGADLRIHAPGSGRQSLKAELLSVEGVAGAAEVSYLQSRSEAGTAYDVVVSDLVSMKHLWVVPFGADADLAKVLYTNQIVQPAGASDALAQLNPGEAAAGTVPASSNRVPEIILSLAVARFLDVTAGDQVQLSFRLGSERKDGRFRVSGVFSSLPGFENVRGRVAMAVGSGVLLSLSDFKSMTASAPDEAFQSIYFVQVAGDSAVQKAVANRIRDQFDVRYRFGVQSTAEQRQEARVLYWATQVFFSFLLLVGVIIAVFALIASMATTVIERRRELGVLKALGLRKGQLFRVILCEAVILAFSAGIAGGAIGFTLAWLFMLQAAVLMELSAVFTLPYITFLATLGISVLAGALSAHLPTRSLLRKPAAELLRG